MKGLSARAGRHSPNTVDGPPTYCITYQSSTGVHYEYLQCSGIKPAVKYATKEAEALGCSFFIDGGCTVPKTLGNDETFKILPE